MIETTAVLLFLGSLIAFLTLAISLVIRSDRLAGVRRRKTPILIGGAGAFVLSLVLMPKPSPEQEAARAAAQAKSAAAAKSASDAAIKDGFTAGYRTMLSAAAPCDTAVKTLGETADGSGRRGDTVAVYRAAQAGETACTAAVQTIGAITAPDGLPDEIREATEKAITTCRNTYAQRVMAFEKAKAMADGDTKASSSAAFEDHLKTSQVGVMLCVAEYLSAAGKAKIDLKP